MSLSTATWPQEEEPSLRVCCECNTRLKGFLHSGEMVTKRFQCAVSKGIQIRCLTPLLLTQRPLALFDTGTQDAFAEGWIAVPNIDPQSSGPSTDWTDMAGSAC